MAFTDAQAIKVIAPIIVVGYIVQKITVTGVMIVVGVIITLGVILLITQEQEENTQEKLEEKLKLVRQQIAELKRKRNKVLYEDSSQFRYLSEMYNKCMAEYHQLGSVIAKYEAEENRLQDKKDLIAHKQRKNMNIADKNTRGCK